MVFVCLKLAVLMADGLGLKSTILMVDSSLFPVFPQFHAWSPIHNSYGWQFVISSISTISCMKSNPQFLWLTVNYFRYFHNFMHEVQSTILMVDNSLFPAFPQFRAWSPVDDSYGWQFIISGISTISCMKSNPQFLWLTVHYFRYFHNFMHAVQSQLLDCHWTLRD